jgi:DNA-binding CsgD family transcriptional regulator
MSDAHNMQTDKQAEAALAKLTANEKECLRRRLLPQTAKEMATDLGISPHAVEKRLKMARAKLGVSTSLAAARLLASAEGDQLLVPHIPDLPDGTNQPQDSDIAMPSRATSLPKGLTMIAAICLIALVGQDVSTVPIPTPAGSVSESSKGISTKLGMGIPKESIINSKTYSGWKIPQPTRRENIDRVHRETVMMASDIANNISVTPFGSKEFKGELLNELYIRSLSEAIVFIYTKYTGANVLELINPYERKIENDIAYKDIKSLRSTGDSIPVFYNGAFGTIVRLPMENTFVYATRRQ